MSNEETTPQPAPGRETVDVTVAIPAHRAAQFERFHQRFLEMSRHWVAQVGNEDLHRGPRGGRRGRGRHGGPGRTPRCRGGEHPAEQQDAR